MRKQSFGRGVLDGAILPSRGATELTTSESVSYEAPQRDPYAEASAYGDVEAGFTFKDPYKSLVQPKKKPEGVYEA